MYAFVPSQIMFDCRNLLGNVGDHRGLNYSSDIEPFLAMYTSCLFSCSTIGLHVTIVSRRTQYL